MLRKFSDGRIDWWTGRWTDGQTEDRRTHRPEWFHTTMSDWYRASTKWVCLFIKLRVTKRRVCVKQDSVISDKLLLISSILPPKKTVLIATNDGQWKVRWNILRFANNCTVCLVSLGNYIWIYDSTGYWIKVWQALFGLWHLWTLFVDEGMKLKKIFLKLS